MADVVSQILEYKELITLILGMSALYWRFDKRVSVLEGWCKPFFDKMFEDSIERVTGQN